VIIGMDFGTTNSGMAVFDGSQVRLLPLDARSSNPRVVRTALYISNDQTVTVGRAALDRYFDENVGRPVKLKRVWVGEVEVYGADMLYVTDLYAWIDTLSPGRLLLSVKSGLRDPEYQGTVVGQYHYSLENLIAAFLGVNRLQAEKLLGRPVREVVLGRPVHFSSDLASDRLAQRRLLDAAFRAGFERVYLQYEPVAAAYHYAQGAGSAQNILVFDFGGGTLDLTVMRLERDGRRRVLATGGLPIAGDVFDQKLVRGRLPDHFGQRSHYGPPERRLPVPRWVFDAFSNWQDILMLQTRESRKLLDEMARTTDDPRGVKALISLVSNNYGLVMFDTVEAAKRELSDKMATIIRLDGPDFRVRETVTRTAFEQIIRNEIQAVEQHLTETVAASGLAYEQIDAVVHTGGSSQVPVFRYMLMEKFGPKKVVETDTFSGVASGLSIIAHGVAAGEIEAEAHTPDTVQRLGPVGPRPGIAPANLELLLRRTAIAGEDGDRAGHGLPQVLVMLHGQGQLTAVDLPEDHEPLELQEVAGSQMASLEAACIMSPDAQLLLVTSRYRFFLTTAQQLTELERLGLALRDYLHFAGDELITALAPWNRLRDQERLVLVTSLGFLRAYPLPGFVPAIEGPLPLQLDQPLPGLPVAIMGGHNGMQVAVALDSGRVVRYGLSTLPQQGVQAINRRDGERLAAALLAAGDAELLAMTPEGYGRRLLLEWVPRPSRPNTRGKVMLARRPLAAVVRLRSGRSTWALTNRRLLTLQVGQLPVANERSTRSHRIVRLTDGERLLGMPLAG
jgi:hypothetical chaperone protein